MGLKVMSAKRRPFCLGLKVLKGWWHWPAFKGGGNSSPSVGVGAIHSPPVYLLFGGVYCLVPLEIIKLSSSLLLIRRQAITWTSIAPIKKMAHTAELQSRIVNFFIQLIVVSQSCVNIRSGSAFSHSRHETITKTNAVSLSMWPHEQTSVNLGSKYKHFHWIRCFWICLLLNISHYCRRASQLGSVFW